MAAELDENGLAQAILEAFDSESDQNVDPAEARQRQAQKIANAVKRFVVGRTTQVTGTAAYGGPVTGTGIIQE